jgi:hypothetical protein
MENYGILMESEDLVNFGGARGCIVGVRAMERELKKDAFTSE